RKSTSTSSTRSESATARSRYVRGQFARQTKRTEAQNTCAQLPISTPCDVSPTLARRFLAPSRAVSRETYHSTIQLSAKGDAGGYAGSPASFEAARPALLLMALNSIHWRGHRTREIRRGCNWLESEVTLMPWHRVLRSL